MADSEYPFLWARTVGAPTPTDRRNGELHKIYADIPPPTFSLEPWEEDASDDAFYALGSDAPEVDEEGRSVWIYRYVEPES